MMSLHALQHTATHCSVASSRRLILMCSALFYSDHFSCRIVVLLYLDLLLMQYTMLFYCDILLMEYIVLFYSDLFFNILHSAFLF